MKKRSHLSLFIEGFIEGWNEVSAKPKVADTEGVGKHLTQEELGTVFALLAEEPAVEPMTPAQAKDEHPSVADVLDAEELGDVMQLLAEAPAAPVNEVSAKPKVADTEGVGKHLTQEELGTVFALLTEEPPTVEPMTSTQAKDEHPSVADILDTEELDGVMQLLAEAPAAPVSAITDSAECERIPAIPVFYFPEAEETAVEELDPTYSMWVELNQQGIFC